MIENLKDVHTEHCCAKHGCKYGDDDCTVETGKFKQSFPCESCGYEEEQLDGQELFAVWRIESHRDREMTFLGVFSTKVRAEKAVDDHLTSRPCHEHYEYTIRDCKVNERGD